MRKNSTNKLMTLNFWRMCVANLLLYTSVYMLFPLLPFSFLCFTIDLYFVLLIYSPLIPNISTSPLPTFLSSLPQIHPPTSISLKKRAGLLGISTEYDITRYDKTGHKLPYCSWMRQSSKRKRVPSAGKSKRVRDPTLPLLGVPQEHPGTQS